MGPTDASDLHGRPPSFPHRRIDRRSIGPFQARHNEINLLVRLAKPPQSHFEKDSHRVVALNQGDGVDRVHFGHIFGHTRPRKRTLRASAY